MSKDTIHIKVTVGGRVYSLNVRMEEEEFVRRAAERIEGKVKELRSSYAVNDEKDLLAMAALQIATDEARSEKEGRSKEQRKEDRMRSMEQRIEDFLKAQEGSSE